MSEAPVAEKAGPPGHNGARPAHRHEQGSGRGRSHEAPLSVVAMLHGRACFAVDGKLPAWLAAGDVTLLRGPDH